MARLGPHQVNALRIFAEVGICGSFGHPRAMAKRFADLGLVVATEDYGAIYTTGKGVALGIMLHPGVKRVNARGRGLLRKWRRKLEREFPHLDKDAVRAQPEWDRMLAEARERRVQLRAIHPRDRALRSGALMPGAKP